MPSGNGNVHIGVVLSAYLGGRARNIVITLYGYRVSWTNVRTDDQFPYYSLLCGDEYRMTITSPITMILALE